MFRKGRYCGDGILNRDGYDLLDTSDDEYCDDGNTLPGDGCDDHCRVELGYTCVEDSAYLSTCAPACGDGRIVPPEECDDGGTMSGDGCDAACQLEGAACGDGVISAHGADGNPATLADNEECDDGNNVGLDGCTATCKIENGLVCGDGITLREGPDGDITTLEDNEECDDANAANDDECTTECKIVDHCGNGILNNFWGQEECDDGNDSNYDSCTNNCKLNTCGDGFLNVGVEQCDDGNTVDGDSCPSTCIITPLACGNGVLDPGEECDPVRFCSGTFPGAVSPMTTCKNQADCEVCTLPMDSSRTVIKTCGGGDGKLRCTSDTDCSRESAPDDVCLPITVKSCLGRWSFYLAGIAGYIVSVDQCTTDADCAGKFSCEEPALSCSDDCHLLRPTPMLPAPVEGDTSQGRLQNFPPAGGSTGLLETATDAVSDGLSWLRSFFAK